MAQHYVARGDIPAAGGYALSKERTKAVVDAVRKEEGLMAVLPVKGTNTRETEIPIFNGSDLQAARQSEMGTKAVTGAEWRQVVLKIETYAAIIVFSNQELDDADGDIMDLFDEQFPAVFAELLDAEALGMQAGDPTYVSGWNATIMDDVTQEIVLDTTRADGWELAAIDGKAKLRDNGYKADFIVAHTSAETTIEKASINTTGQAGQFQRLYADVAQAFRGLKYAFSQNLQDGAAVPNNGEETVGVIGQSSKFPVKVKEEIKTRVATTGSVTLPDTTVVNLFQQNATAMLIEMRAGGVIEDPRAFVRVVVRGAVV